MTKQNFLIKKKSFLNCAPNPSKSENSPNFFAVWAKGQALKHTTQRKNYNNITHNCILVIIEFSVECSVVWKYPKHTSK